MHRFLSYFAVDVAVVAVGSFHLNLQLFLVCLPVFMLYFYIQSLKCIDLFWPQKQMA